PMVPRTAHEAIDNLTVAQRSALVRAHIADREERVAQPEHRDRARPGLDRNGGAGGDVADLADHVFGHRAFSPASTLPPVSFRRSPIRIISRLISARNASGAIGSMIQPWS